MESCSQTKIHECDGNVVDLVDDLFEKVFEYLSPICHNGSFSCMGKRHGCRINIFLCKNISGCGDSKEELIKYQICAKEVDSAFDSPDFEACSQ
jgi:hypothetical protein